MVLFYLLKLANISAKILFNKSRQMLYPGFSKKANINFGRSNQVKMARNRKYQI